LAQLLRYQLYSSNCHEHPTVTNHFDRLISAFAGFQTSTRNRPDGGVLFEIKDGSGGTITRAISHMQLHNALQMEWLISSIRRDMAASPEHLPAIAALQSQQRFDMPTYVSR
jgi:hypothetical protein